MNHNKSILKPSTFLSLSIVLLFGMLWLPLGQYEFLLTHWMKIGTFAVPFLLIGTFAIYPQELSLPLWKHLRFFSIIMLIAYIIHQFEEHWIDILGNEYAFYTFNNQFILNALGAEDDAVKPLTKESIFVINTSLVWLVGMIAILRSPTHVFPAIAMASIIIVNGIVHIIAGLATLTYNPGLLTSLLIFVPIYLLFARYMIPIDAAYRSQLIAGLIWAFLAHIIMVGGLLAANWFHLFPEVVYFLLLITWSLTPLALYLQPPSSNISHPPR